MEWNHTDQNKGEKKLSSEYCSSAEARSFLKLLDIDKKKTFRVLSVVVDKVYIYIMNQTWSRFLHILFYFKENILLSEMEARLKIVTIIPNGNTFGCGILIIQT